MAFVLKNEEACHWYQRGRHQHAHTPGIGHRGIRLRCKLVDILDLHDSRLKKTFQCDRETWRKLASFSKICGKSSDLGRDRSHRPNPVLRGSLFGGIYASNLVLPGSVRSERIDPVRAWKKNDSTPNQCRAASVRGCSNSEHILPSIGSPAWKFTERFKRFRAPWFTVQVLRIFS